MPLTKSDVFLWISLIFLIKLAAAEEHVKTNAIPDVSGLAKTIFGKPANIRNLFVGGSPKDEYQRKYYEKCLANDAVSCIVSRGLSFVDYYLGMKSIPLSTDVSIIKVSNQDDGLIEMSSTYRSTDSEVDQFIKFITRKTERFLKSHSLSVRVTDEISSQGRYLPKLVTAEEEEGRTDDVDDTSRTKKKIRLLLPLLALIKLFKVKLLLIPILLKVIAIKKLLILAIAAVPILLIFLKFCQKQQHDPWQQYAGWSPHYSAYGGSAYDTYPADSYGAYSGAHTAAGYTSSRKLAPQPSAYRGQPETPPESTLQ